MVEKKGSIHTHCLGFFFDVVYIGKTFHMEILHGKYTQKVLLYFFCKTMKGLVKPVFLPRPFF